jgi:hypothetical protein
VTVIRLPGGTKVRTQSGKRYIVVEMPNGRQTWRPHIISRTDKLDYARKAAKPDWAPYSGYQPALGERIIIDTTSGEPVK